jgi:hypothetical protein
MTPQSDKTDARRVAEQLYRKLGRGSSQDIDAIHAALIAYGNARLEESATGIDEFINELRTDPSETGARVRLAQSAAEIRALKEKTSP